MKKRDIIIIFSIAVVALISFFLTDKAPSDIAVIYVDGKIHKTVSLSLDSVIEIGETNVAQVENGQIYMKTATCPDKLCIHQGAISDSSKKIVCLPNKVVIEATSDGISDMVVR